MQVRSDEGVANHIDLEPCAAAREGGGEASVEEHTGQPLSLAKILIPGADAVANAEGNTCGGVKASVHTTRRGRRTWHVWNGFGELDMLVPSLRGDHSQKQRLAISSGDHTQKTVASAVRNVSGRRRWSKLSEWLRTSVPWQIGRAV